jgi:Uma2 family endonuclease
LEHVAELAEADYGVAQMIVARKSVVVSEQVEKRVVLHGVSWELYRALREPEDNNHLRMTYDRGELEIMSPSRRHEEISYLTGRMIDEWTLLHDIDVAAGRNTTFSRKDLEKGLEPDNCYWVTNEHKVRGSGEIDLTVDPPPDLALEVDVSRSAIPKLPIYAALGVPEIWRWKHEMFEILRRDSKGQYQPKKGSIELPGFPFRLAEVTLGSREGRSQTALIKDFIRAIKRRR